MEQVLEVAYEPSVGWAHPILRALKANASLQTKHSRWKDLELSDLAFDIETRLGALDEIVGMIGEGLSALSDELPFGEEREEHLRRRAAYKVRDPGTLRRLLVAFTAFVQESRSCFENLAHFYAKFLDHYFDEKVKEPDSYEKIKQLFDDPSVADKLRYFRNKILHFRAPWLRFAVSPQGEYTPLLRLNQRPEAGEADEDYISNEVLRDIRFALAKAAEALQEELTDRVTRWP